MLKRKISLLTPLYLIPLSYHYRCIISALTPRTQSEQNGQGEAVAINSRFVAKTNPPPVCSSFEIYSTQSSKDINEICRKQEKQTIPISICLKVLFRIRIVVCKRWTGNFRELSRLWFWHSTASRSFQLHKCNSVKKFMFNMNKFGNLLDNIVFLLHCNERYFIVWVYACILRLLPVSVTQFKVCKTFQHHRFRRCINKWFEAIIYYSASVLEVLFSLRTNSILWYFVHIFIYFRSACVTKHKIM